MKKPRWLPDWRDGTKYPDLKKTTSQQWAWEFLRRNSEYQRLWAKLIRPTYKPAASPLNAPGRPFRVKPDPNLYRPGPFEERFGVKSPEPPPNAHLSAQEAKLMFASQWIRFRKAPPRHYWPKNGTPYETRVPLGEEEILVWFDLTQPIELQLDNARVLLKGQVPRRAKARRINPKAFARYLRLLDAKEAGATTSQMAAAIYPHLKNIHPDFAGNHQVSDDLRTARQLRDKGFRLIAATKPKQPA